jgi:PhoH-like ATPase
MRKNFVLDTNVLLHDSAALTQFSDNTVVIPIYCIEELDRFKKDLSELGRNARHVARQLDQFRSEGNLVEGVPLQNGGQLRVAFTNRELSEMYASSASADNSILATALDIQDKDPNIETVFVSMDVNLRIRAEAVGLHAVDYDREHIDISELYTGWFQAHVPDELIDTIYSEGSIALKSIVEFRESVETEDGETLEAEIHENQYVLLRGQERNSHTALCRCDVDSDRLIHLPRLRDGVWGIRARNKEQHFALDALLRDDIGLVTLVGKAGTGKTLLAIAAGLSRTTDAEIYHRLLVSRPIFPLGRDIGYLPGSVEEKLNPWMQPIYDNLELLLNLSRSDRRDGRGYHELLDMGIIEIEPLTYIRGRSIPQQYLIVDEAQNLTPHEVKTIITRAGQGTKVILTGDPYQIDNPYVDSVNNGLTYVVNRFKDQRIAAHITLNKGERSPLAEAAANLL